MTKCKKCKAVISLGLEDVLTGTKEQPKRVTKESRKKNLCEECYLLEEQLIENIEANDYRFLENGKLA